MKILVVSDETSQSLEALVQRRPEQFRDVSIIISCGDLDRDYLEFLVDSLNKELFFVCGNHALEADGDLCYRGTTRVPAKYICYVAGRADLHGRVEAYRNYLLVGFGGSHWYNGNGNQYTEKEMAKIVRQVVRRVRLQRLQDALMRRPKKEVIVVSHAPLYQVHDLPDVCHTGFRCFHDFVKQVSPLLWLHGHVHVPELYETQVSIVNHVTVINAYGCRMIEIKRKHIHVSSHCGS